MNIMQIEGKSLEVAPYDVYTYLVEDTEMLADIAILDGAIPIKVYRKYRQLTQRQLAAEQVGINVPYLSELESGRKQGIEILLPRN